MGIRGELFSTRITCEGRTYFFNVKENRMGDMFLTIVESKPTEADNFDRRSVVIFRDDMKDFLAALQGALGFMQKPGKEAPGIEFEPAAASPKARKHKSHAGFTGAGAPDAGAETPPAGEARAAGPDDAQKTKKLRVVVRRKESGKA
jgi:hypothetical protein